jgi:hypothetical protein
LFNPLSIVDEEGWPFCGDGDLLLNHAIMPQENGIDEETTARVSQNGCQ